MQYDEVAEAYEQRVVPHYRQIAGLVAERADAGAGQDVVELAAGTGLLTRLLAPRTAGGSYIALDVSAAMLDRAAALVPRHVQLVVADLRRVPLPSHCADRVVASLSGVQDSVRALREARRLLRPGGRLALVSWGGGYSELRVLAAARRDVGLGPFPRPTSYRAAHRARTAGFVDVQRELVRLPVRHADVDSYLDYRAAFGRQAWLPESKRRPFLDAVRRHVAAYVQPDGSVCLDWTLMLLTARRGATDVSS